MSHDIRKLIHRIYGIAISAVTVIAGIRFIMACRSIYRSGLSAGGQIYTRQIVAGAFRTISLPVYLCLALVILGFILHWLLPLQKKKLSVEKDHKQMLKRLHAQADLSACPAVMQHLIKQLQRTRKIHIRVSAALWLVCSAVFLVYTCSPARWPMGSSAVVTTAMTKAVRMLAIFVAIPTVYSIATAYMCRRKLRDEVLLMKLAVKQAPAQTVAEKAAPQKRNYVVYVRYGILAIAVVCLVFGFLTGGVADVIAKAAAICTECVGLG